MGKSIGYIFRLAMTLLLLAHALSLAQWQPQTSGSKAQLRGVSAVSERVAWASGSQGTYLRTTDGGQVWTVGTVPGASQLEFRDVQAIDANTAYLLATAGRIFKTTDGGQHWTLQYDNASPGVFLDAFAFWDANNGIALGDPIQGRFLVVSTADGGVNWTSAPSTAAPAAIDGEAAFAASGTCIAVAGTQNVWFATGGRAARVFRSSDRGRTWSAGSTPLVSGADSTGAFSIAFRDDKNGVIVGGDYKKPTVGEGNAARTTDGGVTWTLVRKRPSGYRSAVAYIPETKLLITVGEAGVDYSRDDGDTWIAGGNEGYHAVSISPSRVGWAVGANGRINRLNGNALVKHQR